MFSKLEEGVLKGWPTILLTERLMDCEAMNERLAAEIIERSLSEPTATNSNADSWQSSQADFLSSQTGDRARLIREAMRLVDTMSRLHGIDKVRHEVRLEAWCVVSRNGSHHNHHVHAGSTWSGVYYVKAPEHPTVRNGDEETRMRRGKTNGEICFADPRHGRGRDPESEYVLEPKNGMMILFPSWLVHWVRPHYSIEDRVCIPFNAYLSAGTWSSPGGAS